MNNYDKLMGIINEVDNLILKKVTSSSPDFTAWKTKTERFLINEYGSNSYEINEFRKMHFSLSFFTAGTPDSEFVAACKRGLERAKAVLNTYLEEIGENRKTGNIVDAYMKLQYEFHGIKAVIAEYTDSGVVNNFLAGLEQGITNKDKKEIQYFLSEIKSWYEKNWTDIENNEYVHNLNEHERNLGIISEVLDGIEDCDFTALDSSEVIDNRLDTPIILVSHRSTDKKYGDALEKLFSSIGIRNEQLIYTSHPLHKIPLDKNIYEYLMESFGRKIFVIILWSNEYLDSPACLNEMGAVWVTQTDYTNIYVPTFDFTNPKYYQCSVDKNRMGAVLDGSDNCKASIIELKNKIVELFGLSIDENQWIYTLDQFMKDISD